MADNSKRAALLAEGLTEAEADYLISDGTKTEGLTPSDQQSYVGDADDKPGEQKQTAPETPPADAGDDDDPGPAKDSPFYPQWHREKKKRQALEAQLRQRDEHLNRYGTELGQLREERARIDERLRVFREAMTAEQQPAQQPAAPPDPEQDPFGFMRWQSERIAQLEDHAQRVATHVNERDASSALHQAYVDDARQFVSQNPEFGQAYTWLMQNRDAELAAAGYSDPNERKRIITLDERDIVARALTNRRNNPNAPGPSQVIYGLARARGFQPQPAPAPAPAPQPGARPNGQTNGATPTVTQQVETIQRGQAASRSLSSAGGSPMPQGLDLNRIVSMTDAEFLQFKRDMTPAQRMEFDSILGRGAA